MTVAYNDCDTPATQDPAEPVAPVLQAAPRESTSAAVHEILMMALEQGVTAVHPPLPGRPVNP